MNPTLVCRCIFILTFLLALQPAKGIPGLSIHLLQENGETVMRINDRPLPKDQAERLFRLLHNLDPLSLRHMYVDPSMSIQETLSWLSLLEKHASGPIVLHLGSPDQYHLEPQRYLIHLETLPPITTVQ